MKTHCCKHFKTHSATQNCQIVTSIFHLLCLILSTIKSRYYISRFSLTSSWTFSGSSGFKDASKTRFNLSKTSQNIIKYFLRIDTIRIKRFFRFQIQWQEQRALITDIKTENYSHINNCKKEFSSRCCVKMPNKSGSVLSVEQHKITTQWALPLFRTISEDFPLLLLLCLNLLNMSGVDWELELVESSPTSLLIRRVRVGELSGVEDVEETVAWDCKILKVTMPLRRFCHTQKEERRKPNYTGLHLLSKCQHSQLWGPVFSGVFNKYPPRATIIECI